MADDQQEQATELFATVADLEARWWALSGTEQARASVLLEDATDLIKASCPRWASATAATRRRIVCAMVKRAMAADQTADVAAGGYGVEPRGLVASETHTDGPFSDGFTYSNPEGGLFLRKAEAQLLGGRTGRAAEVDLLFSAVPR
ncbi:Gp19/Gp15/Gp42 family protein [Actinomyces procaprae]|uniref:Gp19/Gp15/Gp42 family protein n=1 Tax=Actinomyces procaprae TaxID=2560010 RepID=UPI0010A24C31|nr:Gp19/Gp15/Gp42 family protein [Actinomyces procaprae]